MQIVIEIDEHSYSLICRFITGEGYEVLPTPITDRLFKEVVRGTPLPKGHGRLIDADAITKDLNTLQDAFRIYQQTGDKSSFSIVCVAETILEADKDVEK